MRLRRGAESLVPSFHVPVSAGGCRCPIRLAGAGRQGAGGGAERVFSGVGGTAVAQLAQDIGFLAGILAGEAG